MGVRSWLGMTESATPAATTSLTARASAAENQVEILQESVAELEMALDDTGWQRLTASGSQEFSREGLGRAAQVARVMAVAHPLIKRGLGIRQAYVWGQGVTIQARAVGDDGDLDVNAIVQAFLDDPGNRAAFTGDQAQEEAERALGTDGNFLIACFTSPLTGFVQVRSVSFDEVQDVILNPEDRDDPWFFKRVWVETSIIDDRGTTRTRTETKTAYYPAITYRPRTRPKTIDGHPIHWDAPIYHVSVNRLDGWKFGIGDAYAALSWARAYRDFLGDWAVLVKALSQFAWKAQAKGGKAQKLRQGLARRPTGAAPDGNPNGVGATAVLSDDMTLEAIPKTGATIDSESGRPLAAMIAAGLDVPVTALLADPGQTGARAVAETLNLPTRLAMQQRRSLWEEAIKAILAYVIREAVRAPQGPLQGTFGRDPFTGRETFTLAGETDATTTVDWPSLEDEVPVAQIVEAIVKADSTGKMPPLETVKLLLAALGVKDADDLIADMVDDEGNFKDPFVTAGDAAAAAFRRGEDPAGVV